MFPNELDEAKVLYYTSQDNYGAIKYRRVYESCYLVL